MNIHPYPKKIIVFKSVPRNGFTLIELIIVIGIVATLAAISVPVYLNTLERARILRTISEIRNLAKVIKAFEIGDGKVPNTLSEIGQQNMLDPWGNPYQFLNIADGELTKKGKPKGGNARKDRFLVPINTDFDLYSMGKDGSSVAPLTAKQSRDDIVRANDGEFVGLAIHY